MSLGGALSVRAGISWERMQSLRSCKSNKVGGYSAQIGKLVYIAMNKGGMQRVVGSPAIAIPRSITVRCQCKL